MINKVILEKLKQQSEITWNWLTLSQRDWVFSVQLELNQAKKVLASLNPKLGATLAPSSEGKYQITIDAEKLLELEKSQAYFSNKGIEPLKYTVNARQYLKQKYVGYTDLSIETDFSEPTTPRKLVSLVGNDTCERLLIDLDTPKLQDLLCKLEKATEGKNVERILEIVNEMVDSFSTHHPSVKGQTRNQVEANLGKRLTDYLNKRKAGLIENKMPSLDIPLEELIDEGLLVCRHKGIIASIAIGHLVQKKILPQGSVRSYRGEIFNEQGQFIGAHAWSVYAQILSNSMFVVDPRWQRVKSVDPKNPEDIGYGIAAVRGMVERLTVCDKATLHKFKAEIAKTRNLEELIMLSQFLKSKHGAIFPDLAKISQNHSLISQIAIYGAPAIINAFKEDLLNHFSNNTQNISLIEKIKAEDVSALLDSYFPNDLGLRDKFVEFAKDQAIKNQLVKKLKESLSAIAGDIPPLLEERTISPWLKKLEEMAKNPISAAVAIQRCTDEFKKICGMALISGGGYTILSIKENIDNIISSANKGTLKIDEEAAVGNPDQETLFHRIARDNRLDLLKLCESFKSAKINDIVDFTLKNKQGRTPIHVALEHDNLDLAASMLMHCLKNTGQILFLLADILRWKKNADKLKKIQQRLPAGRRELFSQILDMATRLHDERNIKNQQENKFLAVVKSRDPAKVRDFIVENSGYLAKPWYEITSMRDPSDNTALHAIAKMEDQKAAQDLLDVLANLKIRKTLTFSPYRPSEIVDFEVKNKNGYTPFEKALAKGHYETADAMMKLKGHSPI